MQQVTFLHSKNGTSVICDDAQASIFASWYNKRESVYYTPPAGNCSREQIVWQNERREGACSFHRRRSLSLLVFPVGKSFALWAAPPLPENGVFRDPCRLPAAARFVTFGGSKPPPYGQTLCGAAV